MAPSSNLHLSFEANDTGATILRVKQQQPPWRVVRGFRTAVRRDAGARPQCLGRNSRHRFAVLASGRGAAGASASNIHRRHARVSQPLAGPRRIAARHTSLSHPDAYLEYLPDQLIPFAGSRFKQTARVELERGASLIWWDRVAPGREASDEIFRFESLASHFELIACGQPIAIERWTLTPLTERLDSIARLGPFRHFASCYVCRAGEPPAYWKSFESQMQTSRTGFPALRYYGE